jgi:hypothetical protein
VFQFQRDRRVWFLEVDTIRRPLYTPTVLGTAQRVQGLERRLGRIIPYLDSGASTI